MSADWARDVVWWHVYPLGFLHALDAGDNGGRDLRALVPWLDHLVDLGANGLMLGPVFASQTHGYDTVDYLRVDPRLGTEADLLALIEACHARGVRVALDGVFNHVGRGHPAFADVLAHGAASRYASWFHLDLDAEGPDGFAYENFEGHDALVTLNHAEPEVAAYVGEVMASWCARGVDAWRLDAVYAVPPAFWRAVLPGLRREHPDVWVFGEMIQGDHAAYVREAGLDSVTQYELWKAIWSSLNDVNFYELAHALGRHADLLPQFLPQTFVGNHDVTRLATQLTDARHVPLALAVLFALPGVPSVYYGDELGLTGLKEHREGGDDAVRPAFPAAPEGHVTSDAYATHRHLIGVRRRNRWVNDATVLEPDVLSNEVLAVRVSDGEHTLALVLNAGESPAEVSIPAAGLDAVAGGGEVSGGDGAATAARVPPHDYLLLAQA